MVLILKGVYLNLNGKKFKRFYLNKNYYISEYGDIYSLKNKKYLKYYIDSDGYPRCNIYVNGKQKHIKIHKIVYLTWINDKYKGQINHIDDNKFNNYYKNLYVGTQKQNICDCIKNNHRVGNVKYLLVYDKVKNITLKFCPSIKFCDYCGHYSNNGSISKFFKTQWFMSNYDVLEYKNINDLKELKSVTTIGDECSRV